MLRIIIIEALKYLFAGNSNRMSDIAACQRFAENQNVRLYQIGRKTVASTAKAGCHLVKNQQHTILITKLSCSF